MDQLPPTCWQGVQGRVLVVGRVARGRPGGRGGALGGRQGVLAPGEALREVHVGGGEGGGPPGGLEGLAGDQLLLQGGQAAPHRQGAGGLTLLLGGEGPQPAHLQVQVQEQVQVQVPGCRGAGAGAHLAHPVHPGSHLLLGVSCQVVHSLGEATGDR